MRELFLQRLPVHVHMVLVSTPTTVTVEELASLADKIMDVATATVSAIHSSNDLTAEIADLKTEMAQLKPMLSQPNSNHSRSQPASSFPDSSEVCWYHRKFGDTPCSYQSGNAKASR